MPLARHAPRQSAGLCHSLRMVAITQVLDDFRSVFRCFTPEIRSARNSPGHINHSPDLLFYDISRPLSKGVANLSTKFVACRMRLPGQITLKTAPKTPSPREKGCAPPARRSLPVDDEFARCPGRKLPVCPGRFLNRRARGNYRGKWDVSLGRVPCRLRQAECRKSP